MANYFVCEKGPMGEISIVYVGDTQKDCLKWAEHPDQSQRQLFVYGKI